MQRTQTVMMRGGLDLVTPPVAMPAGRVVASLNYEPEVAGYKRMPGFERYDGHPSPSDGSDDADKSARRALIQKVPGTGPVRGVHVYDGYLYAFRNSTDGGVGFYKATADGWEAQSWDSEIVYFTAGVTAFDEGETLTGGTSTATAVIERVVLQGGAWDGTAFGYLVVSSVTGAFQAENGTSASGDATITPSTPISLAAGGRYSCITHNFYGAAKLPRMYFANGAGTAFEWDGDTMSPVLSGTQSGSLTSVDYLLADNGDFLITDDGDFLVLDGNLDRPTFIGEYSNHLFLGYRAGSVVNSGVGEPLDYRAAAGAAEFSFGTEITGILPAASTALMVFGTSKVSYLTGSSVDDFVLRTLTNNSGAVAYTALMAGDQAIHLDDAGLRKLNTTDAFGDWRMGTLTQLVEPIFRQKRAAGVAAAASLVIRAKDQYILFFDDMSGLILYLGVKNPETMPFILPVQAYCATSGELSADEGERHFIGGTDGYVYEFAKGNSFDGAMVPAFMRLAWNNVGVPSMDKRFHKVTLEGDVPDDAQIGIGFAVDYAIPGNPGGDQQAIDADAGARDLIGVDEYDNITWSTPMQSLIEAWPDGIGRNIATMIVSEHTEERPHLLSSATFNFTPRRMHR